MLHLETIEPLTFSILEKLMALPELTNFSLVRGTALALKFGHRISVDLDLFSSEPFDQESVLNALSKEFGSNFLYEGRNVKFGIFCYISNIKVDIVHYPHPEPNLIMRRAL